VRISLRGEQPPSSINIPSATFGSRSSVPIRWQIGSSSNGGIWVRQFSIGAGSLAVFVVFSNQIGMIATMTAVDWR
jgi:hypothetical protein